MFHLFYLETRKFFTKSNYFFEKKLDIFDWIFGNGRLAVTSAGKYSVSLELVSSIFASLKASTNDSFKSTFSGSIWDDSEVLKYSTSRALASQSSSSTYSSYESSCTNSIFLFRRFGSILTSLLFRAP